MLFGTSSGPAGFPIRLMLSNNYVRSYDSVTIPGFGGGNEQTWEQERAGDTEERLKLIEAMIELLETKIQVSASSIQTQRSEPQFGYKVFLVHGHNEAVLHETARFLEQLDLDVIILREQPNKGRTIIEKFIDYTDVGFAVILLTGDDRGAVAAEPFENQKLRARQNVILELGFFLGKLGRMRVCALHQAGIEIPSDYSGVLFVPNRHRRGMAACACQGDEKRRPSNRHEQSHLA
jgi:predicted nucleotide-binding protein